MLGIERADRDIAEDKAALASYGCSVSDSAMIVVLPTRSGGGAVEVAMYDDRLEIANPGAIPFDLTPEKLGEPHASRPWNPLIAAVLYRAGIIERWGTGTLNIIDWCRENDAPDPVWAERAGSVVLTFLPARWFALPGKERDRAEPRSPESQPESLAMRVMALLATGEFSKSDLSRRLGQKTVSGPLNAVIRDLLSHNHIERTIPNRPQSRLQRYRLTDQGRAWLRTHQPSDRDGSIY